MCHSGGDMANGGVMDVHLEIFLIFMGTWNGAKYKAFFPLRANKSVVLTQQDDCPQKLPFHAL